MEVLNNLKKYLEKYFTKVDGGYQVNKNLQDCIHFDYHNLMNDSGARDLDIVFCRNVLIYFDDELKIQIINKIKQIFLSFVLWQKMNLTVHAQGTASFFLVANIIHAVFSVANQNDSQLRHAPTLRFYFFNFCRNAVFYLLSARFAINNFHRSDINFRKNLFCQI